jgi:hypothetical protein
MIMRAPLLHVEGRFAKNECAADVWSIRSAESYRRLALAAALNLWRFGAIAGGWLAALLILAPLDH